MMFRLLRPTVDTPAGAQVALAERPPSLDGRRVGLLWNGKLQGDVYLERVQQRLSAQREDLSFVHRTKPAASEPADRTTLDELARCDVVVTALGD